MIHYTLAGSSNVFTYTCTLVSAIAVVIVVVFGGIFWFFLSFYWRVTCTHTTCTAIRRLLATNGFLLPLPCCCCCCFFYLFFLFLFFVFGIHSGIYHIVPRHCPTKSNQTGCADAVEIKTCECLPARLCI